MQYISGHQHVCHNNLHLRSKLENHDVIVTFRASWF